MRLSVFWSKCWLRILKIATPDMHAIVTVLEGLLSDRGKIATPEAPKMKNPPTPPIATPAISAQAKRGKGGRLPMGWIIVILMAGLLVGGGLVILGRNGNGSRASLTETTAPSIQSPTPPVLKASPTVVIREIPTISPIPTLTSTKETIFTIKASSVSLRAGPHVNHPIISDFYTIGTQMDVLGINNGSKGNYWFLVRAPNGEEGWLFEDWLNVNIIEIDNLQKIINIPTPPPNFQIPTKDRNNGSIGTP